MPIVDGTSYSHDTPQAVIDVLERARTTRIRIRVVYGDRKTGRSWEECHDVSGYVGRSTGQSKIPLLCHNARSMGGGGMLDDSVIAIRYANRKNGGWLYRHPEYTGDE